MIARELGYSQETVSHILSNGPRRERYSAETQERVLSLARKLGYRPHLGAQVMRKGKSNLIAVLCFGYAYESSFHISHFLSPALRERGYRVLVLDLGWDADMEGGALDYLIDARVDGVIISHMNERFGPMEVGRIQKAGIPVITLAGSERLGIPMIYGEVQTAMKELVNHLVGLGHRRLLLLTNHYESRPRKERMTGFTEGVSACGGEATRLDASVETLKAWMERPGKGVSGAMVSLVDVSLEEPRYAPEMLSYSYARQIFAAQVLPDAILCTNDTWARGVFSAALEAGLNVPGQIAITGVDGSSFGAFSPYHLTTIVHCVEQECREAARIICDMINGEVPPEKMAFSSRLLIRRSCGAELAARRETGNNRE